MTCLLAIDTSTRYATVAVSVDDADKPVVTSRSWFSQHNHGVELLPRVNEILDEAGVVVTDLTHIAVVIGPGSFSALRVGLATAQGMALAGDIPIVPVSTFEVEIDPYADYDGPICAVVDAGSTGVAWGLYPTGENGRTQERKGLDTIEECAQLCPDDTVFCGESVQKFSDYVDSARILSDEAPTRSADALIKVALRKLAARESRDPSKVEITYARAPNISTPKPRLPDGSRRRKAPGQPKSTNPNRRKLRNMANEKTLILVKPDGVQRGIAGQVINRLEATGLRIAGMKLLQISDELAASHYGEHEGKRFYAGLVAFITSGPVVAICLDGPNAISISRKVMGSTNPAEAAPGTVRGDLAIDIGRNVIHGSANEEDAAREVGLYFKDDELVDYTRAIDGWVIE